MSKDEQRQGSFGLCFSKIGNDVLISTIVKHNPAAFCQILGFFHYSALLSMSLKNSFQKYKSKDPYSVMVDVMDL